MGRETAGTSGSSSEDLFWRLIMKYRALSRGVIREAWDECVAKRGDGAKGAAGRDLHVVARDAHLEPAEPIPSLEQLFYPLIAGVVAKRYSVYLSASAKAAQSPGRGQKRF